jgi:glyoxylase-like metal-dependent hydrolase (beta-lactamase superfamily II)
MTTTTYFSHWDLLVDPAWETDELNDIATSLGYVACGFSTHAHHDHLLWHPGLGTGPRWATAKATSLSLDERPALLKALGNGYPSGVIDVFGKVIPTASAVVPDTDVRIIEHDGHAPGHAALYDPSTRVLVAGDMLSDVELPLPFWPDDLPAYIAALDTLTDVVAQTAVLIPGHGRPTDRPMERLDADRRYLDDVISRGESSDPRIAHAGMAEMHQHLKDLVEQFG